MKKLKTILCVLLSSIFLLFAGACAEQPKAQENTSTYFSVEDDTFALSLSVDDNVFESEQEFIKANFCVRIKKDLSIPSLSVQEESWAAPSPFAFSVFAFTAQNTAGVNSTHPYYPSNETLENRELKKGAAYYLEFYFNSFCADSETNSDVDLEVYILVPEHYALQMDESLLETVSMDSELGKTLARSSWNYSYNQFRVIRTTLTLQLRYKEVAA